MTFDWSVLYQYRFDILQGLGTTVYLVIAALVIGSVAGSVACFGKLLRKGPLYWISTVYINTFRALPETVLVFWIYFCGPFILSIPLGPTASGILSMSLIATSYFAEMARAGIQSIQKGQWEAARTLGISEFRVWTDVIIPQAARVMIPTFVLLITQLVKMSGLVSAIGVGELIYQAQTLSSLSFKYFEFFTAVGALYFVLVFPFSMLSQFMSRKLRRQGFSV